MDFDLAYANAPFIPGGADYAARWNDDAAKFRETQKNRAKLDQAYGPEPRNKFDLFLPIGAPKGLIIFIHGGFWRMSGREDWSHFAKGGLARGMAVAMPSYHLCPQVRIAEITAEIAAAIQVIAPQIAGPIRLIGHSAGGHLAARMICAQSPLPPAILGRITRVVPISPLADLEPMRQMQLNATYRLDAAEVAAESPARLRRQPGSDVQIWVGGQERPAFLWQARLLSEAWDCPWHVAPGRHHFDILDPLRDWDSEMMREIFAPSGAKAAAPTLL